MLILFVVVLAWYSFIFEPTNIAVRNCRLSGWQGPCLVHISDLHYGGDKDYLSEVVELINGQNGDYVCFSGDFITDKSFLDEALDILSDIEAPIVAIPGNHEYWQKVDFEELDSRLRKNGGRLLVDSVFDGNGIRFIGNAELSPLRSSDIKPDVINVLLSHYTLVVEQENPEGIVYDLILAGHTHGGQVRLPGVGSLLTPYHSGIYDYGWYDTKIGKMYVTSGVGWLIKVRFFCRPEIMVIRQEIDD